MRFNHVTAFTGRSEELEQPVPALETFTPSLTRDLDFWSQLDTDTNQDLGSTNFNSDLEDLDLLGDTDLMGTTDMFSGTRELSEIDFPTPPDSLPDIALQIPSQSRSSANSSASSMLMESPLISSNTANARNTTDLTTDIHELSKKLCQSPLVLDEVLSVNAFYLQSIDSDIAKLPIDPSRISTILMIIICLTQVLALFEECISPSNAKTLFDMTNGPVLLLGNFQLDLESQRQMRIQIVQKELTRVFEAAGALTRVLQQRPIAAGSQNQTYLTLLVDIRKRVKFLVQIVRHV